jgi:hypothetical protein
MIKSAKGLSAYASWTYEGRRGEQNKPLALVEGTSKALHDRHWGFHVSDHDLERYHLGMVQHDFELAIIEEHLLTCSECINRAEQSAEGVDTIRSAIISGAFDLR